MKPFKTIIIKSIEMKNLNISLSQDDKYFYVNFGQHKSLTTKNLDNALYYFDTIYNEYLKKNN